MRILLDTNVVLDSMLHRSPWHVEADATRSVAAFGHVDPTELQKYAAGRTTLRYRTIHRA